ncbi:MAG: DUF6198 family protein [Oscillospiraceae bacterium]|nr:DUF6198 family protein [Oscillospiraceae bacterium]
MKEMTRRIWMTIAGVLINGVIVGLFKASQLGVDPFQVLCAGLNNVIPIPFGTLYICINIVLLAGMFIVDRHYIGLGTLINLFLLGYVAQYSQALIEWLIPNPNLPIRVCMLVVALPILCLSSSMYFTADLGVSTYDVWALVLDKRTKAPFRFLRVGTDLVCVVVGFALMGFRLGGMIGVGTIITAFFMGPLIDLFNRKVSQPLRYGKNQ